MANLQLSPLQSRVFMHCQPSTSSHQFKEQEAHSYLSTMDRRLALLAVLAAACAACTCRANLAMMPPCTAVMYKILPCMGYLMGKHWTPDGTCCYGVVALNTTAESWPARVVICDCLKDVATRFPRIDSARAVALPGACGVNLNFTLSPYIDCTRIPAP